MEIPGYTLERRIGSGGQAMVYEAVQHSLERRVALKILNPVFSDSPEFTERFLNEARILASLGHSNAITIHDIGVVDGLHYLSMELVEGGDLRARIRDGLTPATALDYVAIIADCLGQAHRRQVVHRDIKPANVLFRTDGTLLLTDFGIAKRLGAGGDLTLTGTTMGSPSYLSPEQARNLPLDGRADIYSLGAMAFEMLSGRKPFTGESEFATIHRHLTSPVPALPDGLDGYQPLIERMMAKSPDDRFASTGELIEALRVLRPAIPVPPRGAPHGDVPAEAASGTTAPTLPLAVGSQPAPLAAPPEAEVTARVTGDEELTARVIDDEEVTARVIDDEEATTRINHHVAPPRSAGRRALPGLLAMAAIAVAGALLAVGGEPDDGDAAGRPAASFAAAEAPAPVAPAPAVPAAVADAASPPPTVRTPGDEHAPPAAVGSVAATPPPRTVIESPSTVPPAHGSDSRVEALLASAREAIADLRLTLPETDSAMFFYDQVLVIEPDHPEARGGHRVIAERYAGLARSALARGDGPRARALVSRGLSVHAENPRLLSLRDELGPPHGAQRQASAAGADGEIRGESPKQLYRRIKDWFN